MNSNGNMYPGQAPANFPPNGQYYGVGGNQQRYYPQQQYAQGSPGYGSLGTYLQQGRQPGPPQQVLPVGYQVHSTNPPFLQPSLQRPPPYPRGMGAFQVAPSPTARNIPQGVHGAHPPLPPPQPHYDMPANVRRDLVAAGIISTTPRQSPNGHTRRLATATEADPAPFTRAGPDFINTLSVDGQYIVKKVVVRPNTTHKMNLGVFIVKHRVTSKIYIEKRLDKSNETAWDRVYQEVNILRRINRDPGGDKPCLNWMNHDTFTDSRSTITAVYLDFCEHGTLAQYLKMKRDSGRSCTERWVWSTIWSLARALCWMHWGIVDLNNRPSAAAMASWTTICHLDIKPENIFLKLDESAEALRQNPRGIYKIVLGDFGCAVESSRVGDMHDLFEQGHGTRGWFPPENLHSDLYDKRDLPYYGRKTDIWQVGGLMQCMMAYLDHPEQKAAEQGLRSFEFYSEELVATMKELMNRDWRQRPEAVQMSDMIYNDMRKLGMRFEFGP